MNLLVHNVIEREIEREKVQMKPPKSGLVNTIGHVRLFEFIHKIRMKMDKMSFVKILVKIEISFKVVLSKFYPGII